jgi:hypothetical protein
MGLGTGSPALHQRLMADCEAELNIAFHLTGMEGGIEQSEFDGALGEHAVQIQGMVAAVVVMIVSTASAVIPQFLDIIHGLRPLVIQIFQKAGIRFLTIVLSVDLHLQRFIEQVLLGSHDIHNVAQGLRRMRRGIHMNMDAAGVVDSGASGSELPHQFLYRFDVLVLADGRHKFHRVVPACRSVASIAAADGGIADHFPLPVLLIADRIGIVSAAYMGGLRTKVTGDDPRCCAAGQAGHFDLNAEVLASQAGSPPVADGTPTAEEGAGRGFFGLAAALLSAFSSMNSRTPAGTYLPYSASAAFSSSSSKDRSFCAIYSFAAESFSASKATEIIAFFI